MAEYIVESAVYRPGIFIVRLMDWIVGIIEAAFVLRVLLELLGANPLSGFVAAVYEITDRLLGPFAGAFANFPLGNGYVVDVTAVFGMIGYAVVGWLIIKLLSFVFGQ